MVKFYVEVDQDGEIVNALAGPDIMPPEEYDHYFELDSWYVPENSGEYHVINGELIKKP